MSPAPRPATVRIYFDADRTWQQLEILLSQWRRIGALLDLPGPFVYTATRTSLALVTLS